jgi:hypothetical protein
MWCTLFRWGEDIALLLFSHIYFTSSSGAKRLFSSCLFLHLSRHNLSVLQKALTRAWARWGETFNLHLSPCRTHHYMEHIAIQYAV